MFDERRMAVTGARGCDIMGVSEESRSNMKFKTRLLITFFTIILLPLAMAVTAFLAIGSYLLKEQEEYGFRNSDYNVLIDPTQASRVMSDEIFFEVKDRLRDNPDALE